MASLHVAWVKMMADRLVVQELISSEVVTVTGTSAQSGAAPAGATLALCKAVDAAMLLAVGANPVASTTNGIHALTGNDYLFRVSAGVTKIAAKTP